MPVTYAFSDGILEITSRFPYTADDYFAIYDVAVAAEGLRSPTPVLINACHSERAPTALEIQDIAARHHSLLQHVGPRFAILVADDLRYGLGRMFGMYAEAEGCEVAVFRNREKAESWLKEGL